MTPDTKIFWHWRTLTAKKLKQSPKSIVSLFARWERRQYQQGRMPDPLPPTPAAPAIRPIAAEVYEALYGAS